MILVSLVDDIVNLNKLLLSLIRLILSSGARHIKQSKKGLITLKAGSWQVRSRSPEGLSEGESMQRSFCRGRNQREECVRKAPLLPQTFANAS